MLNVLYFRPNLRLAVFSPYTLFPYYHITTLSPLTQSANDQCSFLIPNFYL
jgi:hypothetical protein